MQDWGRLDGGGVGKWAMALYMALQARIQTTENCRGKGKHGNRNARVFESAPAANRDIDSYKQPLLASSRVMIGLM